MEMQDSDASKLKARIMELEGQSRDKDRQLAEMKTEMEGLRKAHEQVDAISQRLLQEQQEEAENKEKQLKRYISALKKKGSGIAAPSGSKIGGGSRFGFGGKKGSGLGSALKAPMTLKRPSGLKPPGSGLKPPSSSIARPRGESKSKLQQSMSTWHFWLAVC